MNDRVTNMAKEVGLTYNFDKPLLQIHLTHIVFLTWQRNTVCRIKPKNDYFLPTSPKAKHG
jgi:hypothetical protein